MVDGSPIISFLLMEKSKDFNPGFSPTEKIKRLGEDPRKADFVEEVAGLEEAIEATKKRIAEYKIGGANISDLEFHLKGLEWRLGVVQKKMKQAGQ